MNGRRAKKLYKEAIEIAKSAKIPLGKFYKAKTKVKTINKIDSEGAKLKITTRSLYKVGVEAIYNRLKNGYKNGRKTHLK